MILLKEKNKINKNKIQQSYELYCELKLTKQSLCWAGGAKKRRRGPTGKARDNMPRHGMPSYGP
jgi:hypothetical protein